MSHREWFLNGNYLIIIVSACVILPLAVMKQLGMFGFFFLSYFVFFHIFSHVHPHIQVWFFSLSLLFFFESISLDFVCSSHHRLPGLHQWFFPLLHGVFPDFCEFCQRRWPLRKVPTPEQLWIFSSAGDLQEIQHPVSAARRAQQHHAGRRPLCCQRYGRLLRGQNVHHQLSGWEVLFGFSPSLSLRVCVWG